MTDTELLAQRKTELAELQGGVKELSKGDKRVEYRSIKELREEIQQLTTDIALAAGTVKLRTKARSPRGSRWL